MWSTVAGLSVLLTAMARLTSAQLNAAAQLTTSPSGITGRFDFYAETADDPLTVTIALSGFPQSSADANAKGYMYHIHRQALNSTGSCASAGPHLDPTFKGSAANNTHYACDAEGDWDACELGDLSGKHGVIFANTSFPVTYSDDSEGFANPEMPDYYILGRSVVLHDSAGVRIACGNITDVGTHPSSSSSSSSSAGQDGSSDGADAVDADASDDSSVGDSNTSSNGSVGNSNSNGSAAVTSSNGGGTETGQSGSSSSSSSSSNGGIGAKTGNATAAPFSSVTGVVSGSGRIKSETFGVGIFAAIAWYIFQGFRV